MTQEDRLIINKLKQKLMEENIPLHDMILFGSRARGDAEPDSDYDVLVIVKEKESNTRMKISDCAWEVGFESNVFIQTIVMTQKEAEEGPEKSSLFMMAVQQEGIRL